MATVCEEEANRARLKRRMKAVGLDLMSSPAAIQQQKRLKTGRMAVVIDFGPPPVAPQPVKSPPPAVQHRPVSYGRPRPLNRTEAPPQHSHSRNTDGHTYNCPSNGCGHRYASRGELASHRLREHPEEFKHIEWQVCPHTGCNFKTKSGHAFAVHSTSHPVVAGVDVAADSAFKCTIFGCHTVCATFIKLQVHSIAQHCKFSDGIFPGFTA